MTEPRPIPADGDRRWLPCSFYVTASRTGINHYYPAPAGGTWWVRRDGEWHQEPPDEKTAALAAYIRTQDSVALDTDADLERAYAAAMAAT